MWTVLLICVSITGMVLGENSENITTPAGPHYTTSKYDFTPYNYVIFEVKACESAWLRVDHINPDIHPNYFMPNFMVVMNRMDMKVSYLVEQPIPDDPSSQVYAQLHDPIVGCDKTVKLYLRWDPHGLVELGTEDRVLMFLKDPFYKVRKNDKVVKVMKINGESDGEWRIFNPKLEGADCCEDGGNTYCVVPDMGGRFYTQVDTPGRHQTFLNICKPKTVFDTNICNCNWDESD